MGKAGLIIFIVLAAIIFIVFIAGLFIFLLQYRKRIIMHENEKKLLALTSILQGQEEERSRMAKDLHDGMGGMLSGIKLNLSSLQVSFDADEKSGTIFKRSIQQLDTAITEMRRIAHNMMPEALLKFGLVEAVQDYCDSINESKAVRMKFTALGINEKLTQSTEVTLYRIIQELVNNSLKHAAAKTIFIQLNKHTKGISLSVEDDGKGFNADEAINKKSAGLQNVQTRVDYLKGKITIDSTSGSGTSVHIEIPAAA